MPGQHNKLCLGVSPHTMGVSPAKVHDADPARPSDHLKFSVNI